MGDEKVDSTSFYGTEVHSSGLSPADACDAVGCQLAVAPVVKRSVREGFLQLIFVLGRDPVEPGEVHQSGVVGALRAHEVLPADG